MGAALMPIVDLSQTALRELNGSLHLLTPDTNETHWRVLNPRGQHAVAVGVDAPIVIEVEGHVGYYCAGMNKQGDASQAAGATGCGGLLVIDGNASARCGISMKGIDIVVKGSVGHLSAFMAQAGNLVVLGDAGEALGDSIYEADLFVCGEVKSLGADCIEKPLEECHKSTLRSLLEAAGATVDVDTFRRYGSARTLYHFHVDNIGSY
jgi:glutamate synthase domain-containing protein 3